MALLKLTATRGRRGATWLAARLDELVTGEKIAGRMLAVRRVRRLSELEPCHIVFVSRAERGRVPEALERTRLKVSSKLLRVARAIRPEAHGGSSR